MDKLTAEDELRNIANAKRENFEDAEEFRTWAQNRARHALESVPAPVEPKALAGDVEWLESFRRVTAENNAIGRKDFILDHAETLLRHVRAPKLNGEQRAAVKELDAATHSHVDGRDLLAELHPRNMLDIRRRADGRETWHEGDWLSALMDARDRLRAAFVGELGEVDHG